MSLRKAGSIGPVIAQFCSGPGTIPGGISGSNMTLPRVRITHPSIPETMASTVILGTRSASVLTILRCIRHQRVISVGAIFNISNQLKQGGVGRLAPAVRDTASERAISGYCPT